MHTQTGQGGSEFTVRRMLPQEASDTAAMTIESFSTLSALQSGGKQGGSMADGGAHFRAHFRDNADNPNLTILVVVDQQGRIVGTNTIDHRCSVAAIGPIAVAVDWWDRRLGRVLMQKGVEVAKDKGKACCMLQQDTSFPKSYCLYASLGFRTHDTNLQMHGLVHQRLFDSFPAGYKLRQLEEADASACQTLYAHIFPNVSRELEIRDMARVGRGLAFALESQAGEIVAYTTGMTLAGHMVAKDADLAKALLTGISRRFTEEGQGRVLKFHVTPRIYPEFVEWMLRDAKIQLLRQTSLMAYGGPAPVVKEGSPMFYSPSMAF